MTEERCSCGATLVRGALACSLCHAPVPAQVSTPADSTDAPLAPGPNGFLVSAPPSTQRNDMRVFSRIEAGPTSFGWTGRFVLTLLCAIPILFVWFMSGGGLVNAVLCLPVFVLPLWFLRESWRRGRVR
jgi:hypothetical protein